MVETSRRVFRIEALRNAPSPDAVAAERHREVMAALYTLAEHIKRRTVSEPAKPAATDETAREMLGLYKTELTEARKMKRELEEIREAIDRTKREIAALHESNQTGGAMHRVTDELDAVVDGTEQATNIILESAETIEHQSRNLIAKLKGGDQGMASDIQEQVMRIFEACNFQDLTGQRITKVVNVLRFIDERVAHMMEIWGGKEEFATIKPAASPVKAGTAEEKDLLNGPALPEDTGRATQDMIDALFD